MENNSRNYLDVIDAEISDDFSHNSDYYDMDSFRRLAPSDNFTLLVHNINSIPKNIANFESDVLSETSRPMVIGFCETKLDKNIQDLYEIEIFSSCFTKFQLNGKLPRFVPMSKLLNWMFEWLQHRQIQGERLHAYPTF